jgi:hypothetical protein
MAQPMAREGGRYSHKWYTGNYLVMIKKFAAEIK